jgi:hypothetical protein
MAIQAQYAATPRSASAAISVANTNRNGTGTLVTVFTAGSSGSRVDDIWIVAAGAVTAGVVRLYINDGSASRLWQEVMVTATTPSTTVQVFNTALFNQALILPTGWSLQAAPNNAETFNVLVTRAGDF